MKVGLLVPLHADVHACISHATSLGFHSGQISIWDMALYNAATAAQLRDACDSLDFEITALWCGWSPPIDWSYPGMYVTLGLVPSWLRSKRVDELLRGAEFARSVGVKNMITHLGYIPDNPLDPNRVAILYAIRAIANDLKKHNQRFLFETGEELPLTLVQLIQDVATDNLGVNFDPANLLINARANPSDALDLLAPFVGGVHAKDAVYPVGVNPKGKETPLGKGRANFPILIKKLFDSGYQGDITIEHERSDSEERIREIRDGKSFLEKIIYTVEES